MRRLLLALALAGLLAPLAGADHVYAHRYVLEGRLLGSDGTPLPGRTVSFFSKGDDFLEPCRESQPVTDEHGDFAFCFHKHDLAAGTEVGAESGGARASKLLDVGLRKDVLLLREPNETGTPPEGWAQTFLVAGRAWRKGPQVMENVVVYGATVDHARVNVTVNDTEGAGRLLQAQTDGYGDYRVAIVVPDGTRPEELSVEVEVLGHRQRALLDPATHRVTMNVLLPSPQEEAGAVETAFDPPERPPRPGQSPPRVSPLLVVAGAAGLALSLALTVRKKKG